MREKLLKLIKTENLTSSKLAELLGVQPSGISHIMSGRNKPSFDLVQKILRRFPNINPDWLLLDGEQMYRATPNSQTSENALFVTDSEPGQEIHNTENLSEQSDLQETSVTIHNQTKIPAAIQSLQNRGNIKRIIVLYDDRSFESYDMER